MALASLRALLLLLVNLEIDGCESLNQSPPHLIPEPKSIKRPPFPTFVRRTDSD